MAVDGGDGSDNRGVVGVAAVVIAASHYLLAKSGELPWRRGTAPLKPCRLLGLRVAS
jgi:hypothetical protein